MSSGASHGHDPGGDEPGQPIAGEERDLEEERGEFGFRQLLTLRPSWVQIAFLVLLTVLAIGPFVALVVVLHTPQSSTSDLVEGPSPPADGLELEATANGVNAVGGELSVLLVLEPQPGLLSKNGLTRGLELRVNDVRGETTYTFAEGEPVSGVQVSLLLADGAVTQYPFDSYHSTLIYNVVYTDADDGGERPQVSLSVRSSVTDFKVRASVASGDVGPFNVVDFEIERNTSTTVYSIGIMALMWGLAITGVLISWAIVIWRVEPPIWVYAYFVGVLFALPPLRNSLPGSPPPGAVVDFVSFYWSIAIVGAAMLLVVGVWIRNARAHRRRRQA
ncbi:MAG: hypothetical protein JJLCMIEE_03236 [Acidimicrobiales bacterium]|nr:hypothetical protein [Acidimicrobiales bacterium]